mmetsp:Transcript_3020/g.4366  ORF Transcript_3020/g.4366 Transcript_3020/m.4366 type:complete len:207 (-) Transcript_3020:973-1593(-)
MCACLKLVKLSKIILVKISDHDSDIIQVTAFGIIHNRLGAFHRLRRRAFGRRRDTIVIHDISNFTIRIVSFGAVVAPFLFSTTAHGAINNSNELIDSVAVLGRILFEAFFACIVLSTGAKLNNAFVLDTIIKLLEGFVVLILCWVNVWLSIAGLFTLRSCNGEITRRRSPAGSNRWEPFSSRVNFPGDFYPPTSSRSFYIVASGRL